MENYTKLSIKYLKFQKKRTILTILGVALASGILFVILTLYFSNFINTRDALRKQADYEIVLLPEQNQDVSALLKQDFVKTAYRGKYYDYYSNSYIENAIYINVKNPYRLDANVETIEQTYGVKAQLNQQLASYYLQGDTGNDTYIILLMFLLLSFVIAVIGVGIIRTTIQLNTMEQIKDYGILRCIGATQGQLKSVIFRMGCMQELLGILGGVVIGFPIAYLVGLSMNIKVRPHVLPFLYVLIVFIGDLFFVMDENGKLVKKISPIEAVRGQTSGTRKVKARKQSIFGKIFGVQGDYAYKNLMSNKRRFLKTIATFALSIAAFITIATIFTSFVQMQKQIAPSYGEYQVYFFNEANDEETIDAVKSVLPNEETLTDIAQNKEVKDVKAVYAATMKAIADDMNAFAGKAVVQAVASEDYKSIPEGKYLMIQCTSVGLHEGDGMPFDFGDTFYAMAKAGVDLIYNPAQTPFLKEMEKLGVPAVNGLKMLLYQGILAYELWNDLTVSETLTDKVYLALQDAIYGKKRGDNIVLIGYMGAGKTTVGKALAKKLGYEFIDTDLYIEAQEEMTIPDIFEKKGEAYFRALETDVIRKLREKTHCVIATGGGLPLRKENSDLLKEVGTVYYLMADADTTYARVKHCTNRPLLQCDDPYTKIQAMMKERGPVYARACHIRVRTDHGTLEEVMDEIK